MKTNSIFDSVFDAIKALHYNHGVGDIGYIRIYADGKIEVKGERHYQCPRFYEGRLVNGRTVKMYGHQRTVKEIK